FSAEHALYTVLLYLSAGPPDQHSFPTRRSSDLAAGEHPDIGLVYDSLEAPEDAPLDYDEVEEVIKGVRGDSVWLNVENIKAEVRSEEHTSELQSREKLVCRLLLEKKK